MLDIGHPTSRMKEQDEIKSLLQFIIYCAKYSFTSLKCLWKDSWSVFEKNLKSFGLKGLKTEEYVVVLDKKNYEALEQTVEEERR